jgi:hypothetical protein
MAEQKQKTLTIDAMVHLLRNYGHAGVTVALTQEEREAIAVALLDARQILTRFANAAHLWDKSTCGPPALAPEER